MVSCNHGGIHQFSSADTGSSWRGVLHHETSQVGFLLGENPADEQISYQLSQMGACQNGGYRTHIWSFFLGGGFGYGGTLSDKPIWSLFADKLDTSPR